MIARKDREAEYGPWRREEEVRPATKALNESEEQPPQLIDTRAATKRLSEFFADGELGI